MAQRFQIGWTSTSYFAIIWKDMLLTSLRANTLPRIPSCTDDPDCDCYYITL